MVMNPERKNFYLSEKFLDDCSGFGVSTMVSYGNSVLIFGMYARIFSTPQPHRPPESKPHHASAALGLQLEKLRPDKAFR